ncbi:MAG: Maf family protein [Clostridiales bacterium]|nr:Maf family protein [Clostridiales bacterium]
MKCNRIILASASPRRKELLARLGAEFEVIPSGGEEVITKEIPSEIVMELAAQKAGAVAKEVREEYGRSAKGISEECVLAIGADTIVVNEGKILGKPADEADACRMLRSLSGKTHQVYTGVCLIRLETEKCEEHTFFEETNVTFYPMTEEEIRDYVDTKDPLDKAGAYGIQGICGKYIRGIQGDYNNVVGLPVARLYHEMLEFSRDWNE